MMELLAVSEYWLSIFQLGKLPVECAEVVHSEWVVSCPYFDFCEKTVPSLSHL